MEEAVKIQLTGELVRRTQFNVWVCERDGFFTENMNASIWGDFLIQIFLTLFLKGPCGLGGKFLAGHSNTAVPGPQNISGVFVSSLLQLLAKKSTRVTTISFRQEVCSGAPRSLPPYPDKRFIGPPLRRSLPHV